MDSIVEQIAKEVMLKLKAGSANRGSAYTPPPRYNAAQNTQDSLPTPEKGKKSAILLTANFRVIGSVLSQIQALAPISGRLIVSTYLYNSYNLEKLSKDFQIAHSGSVPSNKALEGISELIVPAMSVNSLSKAANLIADTYATRVLCHALGEGVKIIVTDESILSPERAFPAGVAKKIHELRRELEGMGVEFQHSNVISVTPDRTCCVCPTISGLGTGAGLGAGSSTGLGLGGFRTRQNLAFRPEASQTLAETEPIVRRLADLPPLKTYTDRIRENESKDDYPKASYSGSSAIAAAKMPVSGRELAKYIDHTLLKANATQDEITKLCSEAKQYGFASVCVNPANVALSAELLKGSNVKVCTVIGFPLGANSSFVKAMETKDAVANGADEIDMVINVGALKSKDYELVKNDIARVIQSASGKLVKVIIETSLLTDAEKVKACELAKLAGADFVKTSTGFSTSGATPEDVALMRKTVGPNMGVKASGGIRNTETALKMIKNGATRIGASASVAIVNGMK